MLYSLDSEKYIQMSFHIEVIMTYGVADLLMRNIKQFMTTCIHGFLTQRSRPPVGYQAVIGLARCSSQSMRKHAGAIMRQQQNSLDS